jgi:hypothetical protein
MSFVKYVFVDESGDLGLHGSKFFSVACVVVEDPKTLSRIIKKARERILKKTLKKLPELKANNSNQKVREYVLKKIKESNCKIYGLVVDKSKIFQHLFDVKNRLYNYFLAILLREIEETGKLIITIDKKYRNTLLRENLNEYLIKKLKEKHPNLEIEIRQIPSYASNELQAADFVVWSIQRKFNFKDDWYFRIIESKIVNKNNMELWK